MVVFQMNLTNSKLKKTLGVVIFIALISLQACSDKSADDVKTPELEAQQNALPKNISKKVVVVKEAMPKAKSLSETYVHGYADFLAKNISSGTECTQLRDSLKNVLNNFEASAELSDSAITSAVNLLDASLQEPAAEACFIT